MSFFYKNMFFIKSFAQFQDINFYLGSEIALLGYSNVGKSTLINMLSGNKKLSRTSKFPGQTKLINFFEINKNTRIVDLPGYGYSKNSFETKKKYMLEVKKYIKYRPCLTLVVLVMDIRHPVKKIDLLYLNIIIQRNLRVIVILNKSDKVSNSYKKNIFNKIYLELRKRIKENFEIIICSFKDKKSIFYLRRKIFNYC